MRNLTLLVRLGAVLSSAVLGGLLGPGAASAQPGWSKPVSIDYESLQSISCPSAAFCAAVDVDGSVVMFTNGGWTKPTDIDGSAVIAGISCASSSFCVAVSLNGDALLYNGHWSSQGVVDNASPPDSVSCPTSSFCVAGDDAGNVLTYSAGTWSGPRNAASGSITSISCPSTTFCAAVDNTGDGLIYSGGSWSAMSVDGSTPLNSVSCPATSYCVASDQKGNVFAYNGSTWSRPDNIDGSNSITSVSCPSTDFCAAVDSVGNGEGGNALIYSGGSWGHPDAIDTTALNSVSCASASFCVAVDSGGQAFAYPTTLQTVPVLSTFSIFPPKFEAGALGFFQAGFDLSEAASVHFVLEHKKAATFVPFPGPGWIVNLGAGAQTLTINTGSINVLSYSAVKTVPKLPPGKYRLEATPSASGATGKTVSADFTVTAPKKIIIVRQPLKVSGSGRLSATARIPQTNGSVSTEVQDLKWKTTTGAYTLIAPGTPANFGGQLGRATLLQFGARGRAHITYSNTRSISSNECGPEPVRWAMRLDFRALPALRVTGLTKYTCTFKFGNRTFPGTTNAPFYVSSHGFLTSGFNKIKCKQKQGKITSCKIKPNSKLKIVGTSTSAYCQRRVRIFASVRCGPAPLPQVSWRDTESWHLTIKAGTPKCYRVQAGKPTKKVKCPYWYLH